MTPWNRKAQQSTPWGQQPPAQRQAYGQQRPPQQGMPQVGSAQSGNKQSSQPYGAYTQQTSFRPGQAQSQQSPYAQATPYGGYQQQNPRANPQYGYQPSRPSQPRQYGDLKQMPIARDFEQEFRDAGMPGYDQGRYYNQVVTDGWANPGMADAYKNWMRQQGANGYPMPSQAPNNSTFQPPQVTGIGGTYEMIQTAPGAWSAPTAAFLRNGGNASPYTPSDPNELARIKNLNANNTASSYMTDSNRRTYEARIANMNANNPASKNDQKPAPQAGYLAGRTLTSADMTALKAIASESGVPERDLMNLSQEEFKRIRDQAARSFMQRVDSNKRRGAPRSPQDAALIQRMLEFY